MRKFRLRRGVATLSVASALFLAPAAVHAQPSSSTLSPQEKALVRAVDAHNAAALALLVQVVNINSGSLNLAGVRQVGDIFRAQFDSLGFTTRWVDGSAFHRAGHLVAEHPGPGPKLLFDRAPRYGVRADKPVPALQDDRRLDRDRSWHHRHERW